MSRFTDEDLAKLPKWAQSRIRALEQDVEAYRAEAVEVRSGDTNVWTWDADGYQALPRDSRVSFTVPGGRTDRHEGVLRRIERSALSNRWSRTLAREALAGKC